MVNEKKRFEFSPWPPGDARPGGPGAAWHSRRVTTPDVHLDSLITEWLTLPDLAERMHLPITKVRQLVKDRQVVAVRRGERNVLSVPAAFIDGDQVLKGLTGTLTLLADNRYNDEEALRWMFTADDTLPGTPVQALAENRGTEVRRRAQALGF